MRHPRPSFPSPAASTARRAARLALVCLALVATPAGAEPTQAPAIAVIGAPGGEFSALTRGELAHIFRRQRESTAAGLPLVPVNLALGAPLRDAFSRSVFGLEPDAMEAYWNERYFHGVSPPHVVGSTEAMLRFVHATPTAVGYVWSCEVDARAHVLLRLPVPPDDRPAWEATCRGQ
ncbi:MAG: hypothetical protein AB7O21_17700 [Gammaproteobacteria bacterium]